MGMVNRTYKVGYDNININYINLLQFYLSLENSLCKDYVTEKFWKVLPYNVIPIVLNAVNMTDIAPPHSYIDIKDFPSLEGMKIYQQNNSHKKYVEFAKYIVRVSEDDALFASFFWWRKFYRAKKCENRHGMEIFCYDFTQVRTGLIRCIFLSDIAGLLQALC